MPDSDILSPTGPHGVQRVEPSSSSASSPSHPELDSAKLTPSSQYSPPGPAPAQSTLFPLRDSLGPAYDSKEGEQQYLLGGERDRNYGDEGEEGEEEERERGDGGNWYGREAAHAEGTRAIPIMPSDLRRSLEDENAHFSQPLLAGDKQRPSYEAPNGGLLSRRGSHFHDIDTARAEAAKATRKRYMYAAGFLIVSLFAFAIQTETAVYIQHTLKWNKAYCMLYFTHGSWSLLYPSLLLILRIQKWQQPWQVFWRRHWTLLRQTMQMVQYRTLNLNPHLEKASPIPYFLWTTAYVTCALTVAGGSWYVAVDLTTASDLTAIYNCSAFFAYVFAVPLLHEHVRFSKVVAVAIAIVGVLVVAYGDTGTAKHGSKSGGGTGGPNAPADEDASNRAVGNIVIGIGSVLYGFYEVLYKKVACPPDGCSPDRGMILAMTFGSLMGTFTILVLWIPLPILHFLGWEEFALPTGEAAWMLAISVCANATFSGCFLVLISLTSPVLSSVAALLTIFLVALCDQMLPPPLYSPLTLAAIMGGILIIFAFLLLSWATYREMTEESSKNADEIVTDSAVE